MKRKYAYTVVYQQYNFSFEKSVCVVAGSKEEAYDRVIDEYNPYSAFVESVTYANGNRHRFNTCDVKPY